MRGQFIESEIPTEVCGDSADSKNGFLNKLSKKNSRQKKVSGRLPHIGSVSIFLIGPKLNEVRSEMRDQENSLNYTVGST